MEEKCGKCGFKMVVKRNGKGAPYASCSNPAGHAGGTEKLAKGDPLAADIKAKPPIPQKKPDPVVIPELKPKKSWMGGIL